jgi:uncharacterized protein YlxW (UPF0749 family)
LEKIISDLLSTISQMVNTEAKFDAADLQISKQDQKFETQTSQLSNQVPQIQADKQKLETQTSQLSNQFTQFQEDKQKLETQTSQFSNQFTQFQAVVLDEGFGDETPDFSKF